MPTLARENLLCHYLYDALDRLVDCETSTEPHSRRFYAEDHLSTEIQGDMQTSFFRHDDQPLAQLQSQRGKVDTTLFATDLQRSVTHVLEQHQLHTLVYTPYGHRLAGSGLLSLLGFNGQRRDPVTGYYLLGNGYRAFNPVLMRFNSPDGLSPFGQGGLNAYAYCEGEPMMRHDDTGNSWVGRFFGIVGKSNFKGVSSKAVKVTAEGKSFYQRTGQVKGINITTQQKIKPSGRLSKERLAKEPSPTSIHEPAPLERTPTQSQLELHMEQQDPVFQAKLKNSNDYLKRIMAELDISEKGLTASQFKSIKRPIDVARKRKAIRETDNVMAARHRGQENIRDWLYK
ncbi:RHS repeat-associated protein [Pseudomonas lini]|uniref:RHS repeat-associated core domain-containing protein n=1 Tax=Pseudomonas lini TaxID=163011 RepID=UPI00277D184F|nr:RHS repeat-associated core domain-containing protein [Pseudomonas lini]MDQ0122223.1 RHS repeat-associated protein [Pseudomonas lini]